MNVKFWLTIILTIYSCSGKNILQAQTECNRLKSGENGFIQLTKNNQPGESLIIFGRVIDSLTGVPIKNASLFLYHTDTSGSYNSLFFGYPPLAKIRGTVRTNDSGCFTIQTILPGDYPGARDNKHIHFELKSYGYKTVKKEFLFDGFLNEEMRKHAIHDKSGIILNIKKNESGIWIGAADIYMHR